ncbi:MAG: septum formation inhibitor Maf [Clostridia bacterium]|nr:septum formation inhibitor Maf [Clostridia bacterium]MBQ6938149.1 septum formation inhibitor Maf [Clostridia bacterium]
MGKPLFVLASASPRRKQLLQSIGLSAQIIPANIDEDKLKGLPPEKMVSQLAMLKATDVARSFKGETYVIGADTCVCLDGEILGKPHNIADAKRMLQMLSGKKHTVYTGYCVVDCKSGNATSKCEKTEVKFRTLSEKEIDAYIKTREPMDKAGAYGIQGKGSIFIEKIEGDYFNVVGLPLCALSQMMRDEFGIELW